MIVSLLIYFLSSSLCRATLKYNPFLYLSQETEPAESVEVHFKQSVNKEKALSDPEKF